MGKDTHALSVPAQHTALQVLAANGVETVIQKDDGVTPAPVISRAIVAYNRDRKERLGRWYRPDGVANPPEDGGLRYNPPNGGPAGTSHALGGGAEPTNCFAPANSDVKRVPLQALAGGHNAP